MTDDALATKQAVDYDREQIDLIKQSVAKGASDLELKLFLYQCKRTGLDPLSRQIHFIKRWNSFLNKEEGAIQTGIDGYRVIADRTGEYAGSDDAIFVSGEQIYPISATVTVWKLIGAQRYAFTATAWWAEYYPGDDKKGFFWRKMPHGQLAKCAEGLALRKAFPQQLSGVYTNEEMQQADGMYPGTKEDQQEVAKQKIAELEARKAQGKEPIGKSAQQFIEEHPPAPGFELKEPEPKIPPETVDIEGVVGEPSKPRKTKKGSAFVTIPIGEREVYFFDTKLADKVKNLKKFFIVLRCQKREVGGKFLYDGVEILGSGLSEEGPPSNEEAPPIDDEDIGF
jgi:phage recombination protein Bet